MSCGVAGPGSRGGDWVVGAGVVVIGVGGATFEKVVGGGSSEWGQVNGEWWLQAGAVQVVVVVVAGAGSQWVRHTLIQQVNGCSVLRIPHLKHGRG